METDDEWIALFRWFHRHPELGYGEVETGAKIKEVLERYHIEIIPSGLKTGIVAVIRGNRKGKSICLRSDMDALPVTEETGLEYASEKEGKMHACGHDFHITAVLYTAVLLQGKREKLCGDVYFVFQPAEEVAGGAEEILRTGILDGVEEFYGFHAEPSLEVGEISCVEGSVMAAVDRFAVRIWGKGCHGATPWLGRNPIPVLTELVNGIYGITGNRADGGHGRVVSVTHVEAGNTWNIIPQQAYLEGTVRTLEAADRKRIRQDIHGIVDGWNGKNGIKTDLEWYDGPDAVVNDGELCIFAESILRREPVRLIPLPPAMVGEDFSKYAGREGKAKSLYLKIGTGKGAPLHSPHFRVRPEAVKITAKLYAKLLAERMK